MKSNVAHADFVTKQWQPEVKVNDSDDFIKTPRQVKKYMMQISNQHLTYRQYRIIDALIEKTCGWHKDFDRITNTQIAEMINLHHTHVSTEIKYLVERNILVKQGTKVGINKNITEWILDVSQTSKPLAKPANKRLAKPANEDKPNQLNTIDTSSIDNKNTPLTPHEGNGKKLISGNRKQKIPYLDVMNAFNESAGDRLPNAESLNDKRRRAISKFLKELKEPTTEAAKNYFDYFMATAKEFYFGENDSGWRASFDYLLRPATVLKTREGSL